MCKENVVILKKKKFLTSGILIERFIGVLYLLIVLLGYLGLLEPLFCYHINFISDNCKTQKGYLQPLLCYINYFFIKFNVFCVNVFMVLFDYFLSI